MGEPRTPGDLDQATQRAWDDGHIHATREVLGQVNKAAGIDPAEHDFEGLLEAIKDGARALRVLDWLATNKGKAHVYVHPASPDDFQVRAKESGAVLGQAPDLLDAIEAAMRLVGDLEPATDDDRKDGGA